jgi:hypothetical protein
MKRFTFLVLIINIFVLITSCGTMVNTQRNTRQNTNPLSNYLNNNRRRLDPEDVVGKKLVGSDEKDSYRFTLNPNGSLEYILNENVYTGSWTFNQDAKMYRYTFDWTEDGKKQGYIMDFSEENNEITLAGHWYITDAYITFYKKLAFEE